ncbi:MAG: MBL fold metallo-hydrolase [Alphaproteobacteria bacterium]
MAVEIPFNRTPDFPPGEARAVSPLIRRIVAPNPGAFTFQGTGTYIVGRGTVAVIDPGPMIESHLQAILDALRGESVSHILVTHTHIDHSPLARPLQRATGAPVWGCGPHGRGRHEQGAKVEESGDMEFAPDRQAAHGDAVDGAGWTLEAVHAPGHTSNHLCFALREENALFTGDHVMGWSTSIISPRTAACARLHGQPRSAATARRRVLADAWRAGPRPGRSSPPSSRTAKSAKRRSSPASARASAPPRDGAARSTATRSATASIRPRCRCSPM